VEKELIEYIAKSLVADPSAVSVNVVDNDASSVLELTVGSDDVGMVIGKNGRIVKAMRTVLQAASARTGKRTVLEIVDR
jgi:predicted RNA-binding protein YlqC (UPF0109 family)